eukprot:SAG11_NODE_8665_length_989_cov_1.551685_2_plen_116_part_00
MSVYLSVCLTICLSVPHFVCASLMNPDRLKELFARDVAVAPAIAPGYALTRRTIDGLRMPLMVPMAPTGEHTKKDLAGVVILGLTDADVSTLHSEYTSQNHKFWALFCGEVGINP